MALDRACLERNHEYIAGFLSARFRVDVSACDVERMFRGWDGRVGGLSGDDWSDGTWMMWLRNRMEERFPLAFSVGMSPFATDGIVTAEMHFFFLFIAETPEMLARLSGERRNRESRPARSKISRTQQHVNPIDKTAAAVFPVN